LKKATMSDLTRASCYGRASILFVPTRASKIFCTALAYPAERICNPYAVTKTSG